MPTKPWWHKKTTMLLLKQHQKRTKLHASKISDTPANTLSFIKGLSGNAKKIALLKAKICITCGKPRSKCTQGSSCSASKIIWGKCNNKGHYTNMCLLNLSSGKVTPDATAKKPDDQSSGEGEGNGESDWHDEAVELSEFNSINRTCMIRRFDSYAQNF